MNPVVALVVPGLHQGGGVPAVAQFVKEAAERSGNWRVMPLSLCMSTTDSESTSLRLPGSWFRLPVAGHRRWLDKNVPHVGARFGEFEFQRYQPRAALADVLAKCDVIQVVCGSPAWANTVLGLGKPVSMHVASRARVERRQRDASPQSLADWWRKGMTIVTDRLDDRALMRVDAIQVMNPWMLEYAKRLNVARNLDLRYAPPGVDASLFTPASARSLESDPYVLCVARFNDPRKKIGLLLESYALLPERIRARVRMVLAGSSGPDDIFWRRADSLGVRDRVTYVASPKIDELIDLYRKASVFALPSDEEGFGVVVLEAMACGIPVVSTRSGGPDGIITDGHDGFLVALGDANAMAAKLQLLLEAPSTNYEMGQNARKTVDCRYDSRIAGAEFVDIWQRLLEQQSTARRPEPGAH